MDFDEVLSDREARMAPILGTADMLDLIGN